MYCFYVQVVCAFSLFEWAKLNQNKQEQQQLKLILDLWPSAAVNNR